MKMTRIKCYLTKKAKNILQLALDTLDMDEFFIEVKRSKLNTLLQKYEIFRMQSSESILDL